MKLLVGLVIVALGLVVPAAAASAQTCVWAGVAGNGVELCTP